MKKQSHCFNCGEDLGVVDTWPGDLVTCGAQECDREARYAYQAAREERQARAEADDYERY